MERHIRNHDHHYHLILQTRSPLEIFSRRSLEFFFSFAYAFSTIYASERDSMFDLIIQLPNKYCGEPQSLIVVILWTCQANALLENTPITAVIDHPKPTTVSVWNLHEYACPRDPQTTAASRAQELNARVQLRHAFAVADLRCNSCCQMLVLTLEQNTPEIPIYLFQISRSR